MTEIARIHAASREDVEQLVAQAESHDSVARWVLFIRRGPRRRTLVRDGTLARAVTQTTSPEPPYYGYLFAYPAGASPASLELKLRDEVAATGYYNLVARPSKLEPVPKAVAPAFWN